MNNTKLQREGDNLQNDIRYYIDSLIDEIDSLEETVSTLENKIEKLEEELSNMEPI